MEYLQDLGIGTSSILRAVLVLGQQLSLTNTLNKLQNKFNFVMKESVIEATEFITCIVFCRRIKL